MYMNKKQRAELAEIIRSFSLMDRLYTEELRKGTDYEAIDAWKRVRQIDVDKLSEYGINLEG